MRWELFGVIDQDGVAAQGVPVVACGDPWWDPTALL